MRSLYLLAAYFLLLSYEYESVVAIQLKTKQGTLDGTLSKSRNGTEFYSFYSIPFAKPPIGDLRFEPPEEADSWEGVRDAKTPPPVCIQTKSPSFQEPYRYVVWGQEDCLYLNVFTPNITFSTLLPVMVHIHGGAFTTGYSALYGPEYFMDHPMVVVTIQYRLHIFGFLSAVDEILPGNYGMKDQTEALKWVQKNIEDFGGDPKRVTIIGESAGGFSVHLHLHSSLSTGLFHQAISHSGTALVVSAVIKSTTAKERAEALGVLSGCPQLETKALVECLRKVPAEQLALAHTKFYVYDVLPPITFGPVVEPKSAKNAFLIENPWKQNVVNSVPWIVGITKDDGGVRATRIRSLPAVMNELTRHYDRLLPLAFYYSDLKNSSAITESMKTFYFGDQDISLKTGKNLSDMFTDGYFAASSLEAARRHTNETFFYLYAHRNHHSFSELMGNMTEDVGVCHVDDLLSLFHFRGIFPAVTEGPDFEVSQRIVNHWVNFVQKGEPNNEKKIWESFTPENYEYLHIKTDSDVTQKKFLGDKFKFWMDVLYSQMNDQIGKLRTEL